MVGREVETTNDGKMLLGMQLKSKFTEAPYSEWYTKEHDEYAMDQKAVGELKKRKINSYNIVVFIGTWCEDSHRDFPRLMKILEEVNYPEGKMKIIAVNRKKSLRTVKKAFITFRKSQPLLYRNTVRKSEELLKCLLQDTLKEIL
uniref:Thioredoxin n=1 Tax=Chryseobacterium endophyticum TaxID=1854762 RepID=A0AAU6WLS0_9FLAO